MRGGLIGQPVVDFAGIGIFRRRRFGIHAIIAEWPLRVGSHDFEERGVEGLGEIESV